jgi:hypothetical protein
MLGAHTVLCGTGISSRFDSLYVVHSKGRSLEPPGVTIDYKREDGRFLVPQVRDN